MAEYIFTYRCRFCGKTHNDAITGNKGLATKFLIQTICELKKDAQHPGDTSIHYAEDHIGIADLIGCKIAKEHGYCDTCKHNDGYPKSETCQGCSNFGNYERGDTD